MSIKLAGHVAATAVILAAGSAAQEAKTESSPVEVLVQPHSEGSFPGEDGEFSIEATCLAVLALLSEGSTFYRGPQKGVVARCMDRSVMRCMRKEMWSQRGHALFALTRSEACILSGHWGTQDPLISMTKAIEKGPSSTPGLTAAWGALAVHSHRTARTSHPKITAKNLKQTLDALEHHLAEEKDPQVVHIARLAMVLARKDASVEDKKAFGTASRLTPRNCEEAVLALIVVSYFAHDARWAAIHRALAKRFAYLAKNATETTAEHALELLGSRVAQRACPLVRPATTLTVQVLDEDGKPATGRLVLLGYQTSFAWPAARLQNGVAKLTPAPVGVMPAALQGVDRKQIIQLGKVHMPLDQQKARITLRLKH